VAEIVAFRLGLIMSLVVFALFDCHCRVRHGRRTVNGVGGIESLNVGRKHGWKWTCGSLGGEQRSTGGWDRLTSQLEIRQQYLTGVSN
jgi:hypothetical protein